MASRSSVSLRAFRGADPRHSLFDGQGAYLKGGRWNSPGRRIIYAAESYAGALLEVLVHLNFDEIPRGYAWTEVRLPSSAIEELSSNSIPNWNSDDLTATRSFGDAWHEQKRSMALLVPSLVTAGIERNVLINQDHPAFSAIQTGNVNEVIWDERLFRE